MGRLDYWCSLRDRRESPTTSIGGTPVLSRSPSENFALASFKNNLSISVDDFSDGYNSRIAASPTIMTPEGFALEISPSPTCAFSQTPSDSIIGMSTGATSQYTPTVVQVYSPPTESTIRIRRSVCPDVVYALPRHLIALALLAADVDRSAFYLCKKFRRARRVYVRERVIHSNEGAKMIHFSGRVFASGSNTMGQCCLSPKKALECPTPRWIRLPAVDMIWATHRCCFVRCPSAGCYAWGPNEYGQLGVGRVMAISHAPLRVTAVTVDEVMCSGVVTFLRIKDGWAACGLNKHGTLGLGHVHRIMRPQVVPNSSHIVRFKSELGCTWAWTKSGSLLACGNNWQGQLGVESPTASSVSQTKVVFLMPVKLPNNMKVEDVMCDVTQSTYFKPVADVNYESMCYASGNVVNSRCPVEIEMPVRIAADDENAPPLTPGRFC